MSLPRTEQNVARLLIKAKVIDELQVRSASSKIGLWGRHLPKVMAELGLVDEDEVTEALGKALNLPVTHLGRTRDKEAMGKLDAEFCQQHAVFPVAIHNRTLMVAMVDPTDIFSIDALKIRAGMRVTGLLASETEIQNAILRHYLHQEPKQVSNRARKAVRRLTDETPLELEMSKPPDPKSSSPTEEPLRKALGVAFSGDDMRRLDAAVVNQQKASTILRAVRELLEEKGYLKR